MSAKKLFYTLSASNISENRNFIISNTNNNSSLDFSLLIGNNNTSPSNTLYDGLYISDPVTGSDLVNLPSVNANVVFILDSVEKAILSATCNGTSAVVTSNTISWSGITGFPLIINFLTD